MDSSGVEKLAKPVSERSKGSTRPPGRVRLSGFRAVAGVLHESKSGEVRSDEGELLFRPRMGAGTVTPREIEVASGLSHAQTHRVLRAMVSLGRVARKTKGRMVGYVLPYNWRPEASEKKN